MSVEEMRDAAFRAAVWQVIEQRAKELKDEAKAELRELQPGDTVAGSIDGRIVGKATMTRGRAKLVVTNESQLLTWVKANAPTELLHTVNPAYLRHIEEMAKRHGQPIDASGELVPGVELQDGDPYVSVRRAPEAAFIVAQLFSAGRVALDGIRELAS